MKLLLLTRLFLVLITYVLGIFEPYSMDKIFWHALILKNLFQDALL